MLISINFTNLAFSSGSNKLANARALKTMMDAMVALNRIFLEESAHGMRTDPTFRKSLYKSGVVYDRTVWWEPIPALYGRGYGDCKSLTAAWIAQAAYFANIKSRPVFRFVDNADGSTDYHILAMLPNGSFEDPSKKLGMGADEVAKFYGPNSYGFE